MTGLDWMFLLIGLGVLFFLMIVAITFFADKRADRFIELKKNGIPPKGYEWSDK